MPPTIHPRSATERSARHGNLVSLIRRRTALRRGLLAFVSGAAMSTAFAPLEWHGYVWIGLVPVLWLALDDGRRAGWIGYSFGVGHFSTTFYWLNEVFLPGPIGLGAICAVFPAAWAFLARHMVRNLRYTRATDLAPKYGERTTFRPRLRPGARCLLILLLPTTWCTLEWCRSWFLSGFPWNQLGISQWSSAWVLPVAAYTGVYGISFLIVATNSIIWSILDAVAEHRRGDGGSALWPAVIFPPIPMLLAAAALVTYARTGQELPAPNGSRRIAVVQGNIPQIRVWNPEQLAHALEVYTSLTRDIAATAQPDLIVWPETAVAASLRFNDDVRFALDGVFATAATPLLAGTIDYRLPPEADTQYELPLMYNSAILFDKSGRVMDIYDKIHLVPFGEYVPFEAYLPQLTEWIGMGRSLSAGHEYSVMLFDDVLRIGVVICYEDIFPEISREMVVRGANLLISITNDAWFGESAGSRQHLAHTVFRAVENGRPVLRSGNNSYSCLIMPDGDVVNVLYDAGDKSYFTRAAKVYDVPVWGHPPLTFFSRFGTGFAHASAAISAVALWWCFYRYVDRKRRLFAVVSDTGDEAA